MMVVLFVCFGWLVVGFSFEFGFDRGQGDAGA